MKKTFLFVAVMSASSCAEEGSPIMRPGEDCMTCHNGEKAPKWTAAGTVYGGLVAAPDAGLQGVTVELVAADDKTIELTTNAAGNFFTAEPLTMPIRTAVKKDDRALRADEPQPRGNCNSCHGVVPEEEAKGRLYWAPELL